VQEIYQSNDRVFLVSPSLKATHKSLAELDTVLDESQVTRIIEKLLQLCVHIHAKGITAANLHPNNVFIDEDNADDVLVTDIGFTYMPSMDPITKMQLEFAAPEVRGKSGILLEKAVHEAPATCDLYSVGAIAKFLLVGTVEYSADDLEGQISSEMQDFLRKVESENPFGRVAANPLLRMDLFDNERLARQESDLEFAEKRNAQKALVASRMKTMGTASIMEQIMLRFVASAQQN